jgi:flagellar protein FlaG
VNTESVQPLSATATKPASGPNTTSAPKHTTTGSPAHEQALIQKSQGVQAPQARTVQETVAAVAAQLESYLRSVGRELQFSIDSASGETVVRVRDPATGDVIRQIPSEEALRLAQSLGSQSNSLVDVIA